ncbi:inositol monophosphatase [uncultured Leifsonia sp.]|uniref:inositol monophosphatase family protein n=1 Tax=uncultured Leifsonia sp. TaxID=340359 RepID=UPI0028D30736|nr:inositol monophosphatase [uncultured Leifsonia sp.]
MTAAHALALELGAWAVQHTRTHPVTTVTTKADPADLVTDLDRSIEKYVRERVRDHFPDHAFVGEEFGGEAVPGRPTWYLDPVDGTTNLANAVPWTAFSLALAVDDRPLVAVVADPWQDTLFDAVAGEGARRDGAQLTIRTGASLTGGVVGSELAGHRGWSGLYELAQSLSAAFCTLRVMGSGTLTLLGPAAGRGVGGIVHRFSPVDHLAAVLIAHEAGATVLDGDGRTTLFPGAGGVLVAAPETSAELFSMWKDARDRASRSGSAESPGSQRAEGSR